MLGPYLSTNQPSIGTSQVSNSTNKVKATWMAPRSQPNFFWMSGTKKVQPYCRLAIITMQMTPTTSWLQRSAAEARGAAAAPDVVVIGIFLPASFIIYD